MSEKRFVVCETVSGMYVAGNLHNGCVEAMLFKIYRPQFATKLTREAALGLAAALPALGMSGTFAVEEVAE